MCIAEKTGHRMNLINKQIIIVTVLTCVLLVTAVIVDYTIPFSSLTLDKYSIKNNGMFQEFYDTGNGFNEMNLKGSRLTGLRAQ